MFAIGIQKDNELGDSHSSAFGFEPYSPDDLSNPVDRKAAPWRNADVDGAHPLFPHVTEQTGKRASFGFARSNDDDMFDQGLGPEALGFVELAQPEARLDKCPLYCFRVLLPPDFCPGLCPRHDANGIRIIQTVEKERGVSGNKDLNALTRFPEMFSERLECRGVDVILWLFNPHQGCIGFAQESRHQCEYPQGSTRRANLMDPELQSRLVLHEEGMPLLGFLQLNLFRQSNHTSCGVKNSRERIRLSLLKDAKPGSKVSAKRIKPRPIIDSVAP